MCLAVMAIVRLSYFFGRRQLTNLPMLQKQYEQCDFSAAKEAKDSSFLKSAEYYDADKVNMPLLSPNQPVVIQHPKTGKWDSAGIRCGSAEHMQPNCPKSAGITCNICKQPGHMSSVLSGQSGA